MALIRKILAMRDEDVAVVTGEEREMMDLVRQAVLLPIATIMTFPLEKRNELLQYREQLQSTMGIVPTP